MSVPEAKIAWSKIWQWHAPNFKNGFAHISLGPDLTFRLRPGPGFGEGAHPTTRLMLSAMAPLVKDKIVVDIGSGTGVLSIAAHMLGARAVYAFEIDPEAIEHSKENFSLNQAPITMNQIPGAFDVVLVNMISSEQRIALQQYPFIDKTPCLILTSGVLVEEEERYLEERKAWHCLSKTYLEGWASFFFASMK